MTIGSWAKNKSFSLITLLGSWFFLHLGTRVYNKILELIRKQYWDRGYQEVLSPNMYNMKLWETSGHDANYKENMFVFDIEKQEFGLKPMNCPGHCLMFANKVRSYRELPLRLADFGVLHCNEASGALSGLTRVRRLQQINEGDGAFYGPKIDISVSDVFKRKFQCATLQLDFQLPAWFNLNYSAEDEGKEERPVMIHRAVLGSVERMFAILLEHYKGKWPFWLSPHQAIVCPVSEKSQPYALQVREAQLAQYNFILVGGEKEAKTGQVSVRARDEADHLEMSIENLLKDFKEKTLAFQYEYGDRSTMKK